MGRLITDAEIGLFHSVATEIQDLAGVEVKYYDFSVDNIQKKDGSPGFDPLYGEKKPNATWGLAGDDEDIVKSLGKPFIINGIYEHDEKTASASERGLVRDSETQLWFARKDFDKFGIGEPKTGAIVEYRNILWTVNRVIKEGWIDMSHDNFSLYKMAIVYNTRLDASKRLSDKICEKED